MELQDLQKALKNALEVEVGKTKFFDYCGYYECDSKSQDIYRKLMLTVPLRRSFNRIRNWLFNHMDTHGNEVLINNILNQKKSPDVTAFYARFVRSNKLTILELWIYPTLFENLFGDVFTVDYYGNISVDSEWFHLFETVERVMNNHIDHTAFNTRVYQICYLLLRAAANCRDQMVLEEQATLDQLLGLFMFV